MIAAIASARDLPLYPRNAEDFTGLGDLVEVSVSELPAAFAPLGEVEVLFAQRGVVAVAGVEPGVVRQVVEDSFGDVVE